MCRKKSRLNNRKINKVSNRVKKQVSSINKDSNIINSKNITPSKNLSYYTKNKNKYKFYNNNYHRVKKKVQLLDGEIIKFDKMDKKGKQLVSKRLKK